tara:strand:- start:1419 stop:2462 length:1044 start_codon:yes stop_codon:yes gene_type:complete
VVGDASPFFDIVENESKVLQDSTPFQFVKVEGEYKWHNSNRSLELKDDSKLFATDGGRLYLIVKPNWAVRLKIETNINGYFRPLSSSDYSSWRSQYDAEVYAPILSPFSEIDSSLEITLRGKSALAITMTGDEGSWDKEGSFFDQHMIVSHNMSDTDQLDPPSVGWGFALSLTGRFGNWQSRESNLTLLKTPSTTFGFEWMRITIINATTQDESIGGIEGDLDMIVTTTGDPDEFIDTSDWRDYDMEYGFDNNSARWEVSIKQRSLGNYESLQSSDDAQWGVFMDGVLMRTFESWNTGGAYTYYEGLVEQRRAQGNQEESGGTDWVKWAIFGVVGVVIVGAILKVRG